MNYASLNLNQFISATHAGRDRMLRELRRRNARKPTWPDVPRDDKGRFRPRPK